MKKTKIVAATLGLVAAGVILTGGHDAFAKSSKQFKYSVHGNSVTIKGYTGKSKKLVIPKKIKGKKVTKIGNYAFDTNKRITSVSVPDTVKDVGYAAFIRCSNLKKVKLSKNMNIIRSWTFSGDKKLKEVTGTSGIKTVSNQSFSDCKKIEKLNMPKLSKVLYKSFENCKKLKKISSKENKLNVDFQSFENCANLESIGDREIQSVGDKAFSGCKNLTGKFTFSSNIKSIPCMAFSDCEKIEFVIPETIKNFGELCFANCKGITSIVIPEGVGNVGEAATAYTDLFKDDYKCVFDIEKYYKDKVHRIFNMNAFAGCTNVTSLTVKDTSGDLVLDNDILYNKEKDVVLYVVPNGKADLNTIKKEKELGPYSLSGLNVEKYELPESVEKVHEGLFYGADVKEVKWNSNLTKIPRNTFKKSQIEKMDIPEGVTELGEGALTYCPELKSIYIPASLTWQKLLVDGTGDETVQTFEGNTSLEKIETAKGHESLKSKDGILFAGKILVCYPAGKQESSYTVPKGVELGTACFDSLQNLKKIIVSENSEDTCSDYVKNCSNLKIYLPKSMKKAKWHGGDNALFRNCSNCYAYVYKNSNMHKFMKKHMKGLYRIRK